MSKENENFNEAEDSALYITYANASNSRIVLPLEMIWQPKEDITTYELAMCLPYFFSRHGVMPHDVDKSLPHFRHFKIIDHNVK